MSAQYFDTSTLNFAMILFEVFIVPTVAGAILLLLLSGFRPLQVIGFKLSQFPIRVRHFSFTVTYLFLVIMIFRMITQCVIVHRTHQDLSHMKSIVEAGTALGGLKTEERLRFRSWRAERNFWIVLLELSLWLTVWRVTSIIDTLHTKISAERSRISGVAAPASAKGTSISSPSTTATLSDMPQSASPLKKDARKRQQHLEF